VRRSIVDERGSRQEPRIDPPFWLVPASERGSTGGLGPAVIVEAAHRLIHEEGLDALGMRPLAREVGVGTTAVYWYVKRKRYLLLAVADLVLQEVEIPPAGGSWRTRLTGLSRSVRDVLRAHPHVHAILSDNVIFTPATVRLAEACLAILADTDLTPAERVHAYNAWAGYVIGFSIVEMKPAPAPGHDEFAQHVREHLRSLDPGDFPQLVGLSRQVTNRAYAIRWEPMPLGGGKSFAFGLEALLDGFEAKMARRTAGR
jgi:TetR/AcrR family tetracycline transcriptional repressor